MVFSNDDGYSFTLHGKHYARCYFFWVEVDVHDLRFFQLNGTVLKTITSLIEKFDEHVFFKEIKMSIGHLTREI